MILGFVLARVLPVWSSVAPAIFFELVTAWNIADGLTRNVLMLIWPMDMVIERQSGG